MFCSWAEASPVCHKSHCAGNTVTVRNAEDRSAILYSSSGMFCVGTNFSKIDSTTLQGIFSSLRHCSSYLRAKTGLINDVNLYQTVFLALNFDFSVSSSRLLFLLIVELSNFIGMDSSKE